jgi:uncharacterized protein YtpQ (UPF0354 family)
MQFSSAQFMELAHPYFERMAKHLNFTVLNDSFFLITSEDGQKLVYDTTELFNKYTDGLTSIHEALADILFIIEETFMIRSYFYPTSVYPVLKQRSFIEQECLKIEKLAFKNKDFDYFFHEFTPSTVILYAFDLGPALSFLTHSDMAKFGLDDSIKLTAIENITRKLNSSPAVFKKVDIAPHVHIFELELDDVFKTSAVLNVRALKKLLTPHLPHATATTFNPCVFIPNNTTLWLVDPSDVDSLNVASALSLEKFMDEPSPLFEHGLLLTEG